MAEPRAPLPVEPGALGFERIVYGKDAVTGVATVLIDRPEVLNAFDFQTLRELGRAFEDASWDDAAAGVVAGGGNELQMACDLSVMVDEAYIRHVGPEHGSVPAGGATQWLPLLVGDRRAREIVMLWGPIRA